MCNLYQFVKLLSLVCSWFALLLLQTLMDLIELRFLAARSGSGACWLAAFEFGRLERRKDGERSSPQLTKL